MEGTGENYLKATWSSSPCAWRGVQGRACGSSARWGSAPGATRNRQMNRKKTSGRGGTEESAPAGVPAWGFPGTTGGRPSVTMLSSHRREGSSSPSRPHTPKGRTRGSLAPEGSRC